MDATAASKSETEPATTMTIEKTTETFTVATAAYTKERKAKNSQAATGGGKE